MNEQRVVSGRVAVGAVVVLLACGGGDSGGAPAAPCVVQSVSVAPATASVQAGRTLDLTVGVVQQNCGTLAVTWSTSAPNVATV
ncbi:MAG: Ig-like domain-containing protein, partial [Gemmatimonadetes bacterium]|nr:Ig-like domain-containing protein [Gemmatimonadota bacterium]